MARLNEPAVPTESIDSLRKRFMRQNREIARVNSNQAVRIRSLENELSILLAENLSLREQVSHYTLEVEDGKTQRIVDHTNQLKLKLEEKLQEIGALVIDLGHVPRPKKQQNKKGRISILHNGQDIAPRERRVLADQEGRLPAILENKSYPRKTLEYEHFNITMAPPANPNSGQELLDMISSDTLDTTDSPEIGPPPVSHFVDEDPVKIDLPKRSHSKHDEDGAEDVSTFSVNLERRKRKDSFENGSSRRSSKSEILLSENETAAIQKTGAKRKLSVREDEDNARPAPTENQPGFDPTTVYGEGTTKVNPERQIAKATRDVAVVAKSAPQDMPTSSVRRVLAPKSVNNSPKKAVRYLKEDSNPSKPDVSKLKSLKGRTADSKETISIQPTPYNPPPVEIDILQSEIEAEPQNSAGFDLFSPHSSHPSSDRVTSRDTPPPTDLGSQNESQRPSRRARGAVSYAEPNLRDKMRRPTKDLVDAVTRDEKGARMSLSKVDDDGPTSVAKIKTEQDVEADWRTMAVASVDSFSASPLRNKTAAQESLPSNITTHRKRRESLLQQSELEEQAPTSGSAIVALLAEKRKAKAAAKGQDAEREQESAFRKNTTMALDNKEIDRSSKPQEMTKPGPREVKVPVKSRRYSSIPRETTFAGDSEGSDIEASRKPDIIPSRRRQSSLGINNPTSSGTLLSREGQTDGGLKRSVSSATMVASGSVELRNDKVAARRKSMMI